MNWFVDDPRRGQTALTISVLLIAVLGIWLGRKKLILSVPIALVFLFWAAIAIPGAIPARPAAQRNVCVFHLRAIQDAKTEWARANQKQLSDIPTEADLYGTSGFLRHRPECPLGGIYTINPIGQNPVCTFSTRGHHLQ